MTITILETTFVHCARGMRTHNLKCSRNGPFYKAHMEKWAASGIHRTSPLPVLPTFSHSHVLVWTGWQLKWEGTLDKWSPIQAKGSLAVHVFWQLHLPIPGATPIQPWGDMMECPCVCPRVSNHHSALAMLASSRRAMSPSSSSHAQHRGSLLLWLCLVLLKKFVCSCLEDRRWHLPAWCMEWDGPTVDTEGIKGCDVASIPKGEQGREVVKTGTLLWLGVGLPLRHPCHRPPTATVDETFRDLNLLHSKLVH